VAGARNFNLSPRRLPVPIAAGRELAAAVEGALGATIWGELTRSGDGCHWRPDRRQLPTQRPAVLGLRWVQATARCDVADARIGSKADLMGVSGRQ
jgi:hypothetical protein